MNPNKKNIFKTYLNPLEGGLGPGDNPDDYPLVLGKISSLSSNTSAVCGFDLDTGIYMNNATPGIVNTGDFVYLNNTLNFPFQGNDRYYKITIDSVSNNYFVRINNNGLIYLVGLCA